MAAVTARIGRVSDLRMAWRYGGTFERRLVVAVVTAPAVGLSALLAANLWLFLSGLLEGAAVQVNVVILMAALSWPFLQPGITAPMYGNAYYREAIRQRWLSPLQCEYAAEIIRYREAVGASARPDNLGWAWALVVFYDAGVCLSGLFALALFPSLGTWTWPAFAVWYLPSVAFVWRYFWRQMRRQGDAAARMGFRMREISAEMLEELKRERNFRGRAPREPG